MPFCIFTERLLVLKQVFILFLFLFTLNRIQAQVNLVPNHSFEVLDSCPYLFGQLRFASPWFHPHHPTIVGYCSSDLYSDCSSVTYLQTPSNYSGYQYPRTGSAYVGIGLYTNFLDPYSHEYIEAMLTDSLEMNRKYCVAQYIVPAENFCGASSAIGVYFSNDTCQLNTFVTLNVLPHVPQAILDSNNIVSDTTSWTQIYISFIAQGGERFMTIGNFWVGSYNETNSISFCPPNPGIPYYYIDDVSVVRLPELNAGNDAEILLGDSIQLNGSISETWPGMSFEWLPHTGLNNPYSLTPFAQPSTSTTYTLTVICATCEVPCLSEVVDSTSIFVHQPSTPSFSIPSILQQGEPFYVQGLPTGAHLRVYDVRGRNVYASTNYDNAMPTGNLSAGVYVYLFEFLDGTVREGKFELVKR
jgi:hypothetical protein